MSLEKRNNKYDKNEGSIFIAPQSSWLETLRILWLKKEDWLYKQFVWKNITDIWSGLGWFVLEIENSCNKVNAVDPLYATENNLELLVRDQERLVGMIHSSVWTLKSHKAKWKDISDQINELFMLSPSPRNIDEISCLEKQLTEQNKSTKKTNDILSWKEEVLDDVKNRSKRWFDDSDKIKIIWKSGENTWIDSNTQDYVLIKHLINKNSVDPNGLLTEALRITKPGWTIFIIDNFFKLKQMQSILNWLDYSHETKGKFKILTIKK
jgi:hypothetical protein